jgi:C-terminal processing protease CtpA/Prc
MVQAMNADRVWIDSYRSFARFIDPTLESEYARELYYISTQIESAYDSFEPLSVPVQFEGPNPYLEPSDFVWKKPLLVLIDELSGSGGDAFPMLLKSNRLARFFGERTMGLGGSVEPTVTLPNMQATLYLTRGLFTTYREDGQYTDASYIENSGVEPDLRYVLTVDDVRGGYVNYMTAFSDVIWNMANPGN